MLRGRSARNRNPSNLHVVPISAIVNGNVVPPIIIPPTTQFIPPAAQFIPPVTHAVPHTGKYFDTVNINSNYLNKYNKKRRKRQRKRDRKRFTNKTINSDYAWVNPNITREKNYIVNAPKEKATDKAKVVSEVPLSTDEDFEEVEVASSEGEGKRIPVGFRQTKPCYLNYKKKSFFKPKFFNFSSQRTVVNCLNVEDDDSVDVDVVSEAEYDEYEADAYDAAEKFGTIIEIEDDEATEDGEEETANKVEDEIEESSNLVADEAEESTQAISNEVTQDDINKVDKKSVAEEVNEKCSTVVEVNEKSHDIEMISDTKKEKIPDNNEVCKTWISKACIEGSDDLIQGKSVIQDKLDLWGSHLIGLEYLLEICDKSKVSVLKYYCVLCDEEIDVQELPESYVINHINGYNHVTKYLEKHFPNCGFNINEKNSYDFVIFQKLCEKINEDLGYHLMCNTNSDYYSENKLKIKEIIENGSHSNEKDFNLEKIAFEKKVASELTENISNIIKNLISKVIPEDEITAELKKDAKDKSCSEDKLTDPIKKPAVVKPRPKHKQNNSISAFLRLKFAATNKLGSDKEKSNKSKNKKDKSNSEQSVESVKPPDEKYKEKLPDEISKEKLNDGKNKVQQVTESIKEPVAKNIKTSPLTKNTIKKIQPKEDKVIETITLDDEEESDVNLKNDNEVDQTKSNNEAQNLEKSTDNSAVTEPGIPKVVKGVATKKIVKNKDKVFMKTTVHSKHCPKINQVISITRQIKVC